MSCFGEAPWNMAGTAFRSFYCEHFIGCMFVQTRLMPIKPNTFGLEIHLNRISLSDLKFTRTEFHGEPFLAIVIENT